MPQLAGDPIALETTETIRRLIANAFRREVTEIAANARPETPLNYFSAHKLAGSVCLIGNPDLAHRLRIASVKLESGRPVPNLTGLWCEVLQLSSEVETASG